MIAGRQFFADLGTRLELLGEAQQILLAPVPGHVVYSLDMSPWHYDPPTNGPA
jgi:hypothetical protein